MSIQTLEQSFSHLAAELTQRIANRPSSSFRRVGEQVCQKYVERLLAALRDDLESGKAEALREVVHVLVDELSEVGLTFSDLRFLVVTLRSAVRAVTSTEPELRTHQQIDDWLLELTLVSTMRYMARREEQAQKQTAKHEVQALETQLTELQIALEEKTQLLELIRQASTPIAPVVQGILVVPLVGMFDSFRAELLTERLLAEIARLHARAVILDISGVAVLDAQTAQLIIRLVRSVRLLGTKMLLVGISPENARTIVALGIDLSGLETLGTLQDGLAKALVSQRLEIVSF